MTVYAIGRACKLISNIYAPFWGMALVLLSTIRPKSSNQSVVFITYIKIHTLNRSVLSRSMACGSTLNTAW